MEAIGGLGRLIAMPWAFLLRVTASLIGLCTLISLFVQSSPLLTGASFLGWLGLPTAAESLVAAREWVHSRGDVFAWVAVGLVFLGVVTASTRSRGAPVAVIGMGVAAEVGALVSLWPLGALVLAWVVSHAYGLYNSRHIEYFPGGVHDWLNTALAELATAVFYIPAAPIRWVVNPRSFQL